MPSKEKITRANVTGILRKFEKSTERRLGKRRERSSSSEAEASC